MYKVDIEKKSLHKMKPTTYSELQLKERYDIQEWIDSQPCILGEDLLIIAKEYDLPSRIRLDLLAVDRDANLVIIELKRDDSGNNVDWQSIKYASYCSNLIESEICDIYAEYLNQRNDTTQEYNATDAKEEIEKFLEMADEVTLSDLNNKQRIILASREFHSDVVSSVMWLRDNYGVDMQCVKLEPYLDERNQLYITPTTIIPLPEAKDYIIRKEKKQKGKAISASSSFSLEKGSFNDKELLDQLVLSFTRNSPLTERLLIFFEVLLTENKEFSREEIIAELYSKGIGETQSKTAQLLSNISQFITNPKNPHIRQILIFESGGSGARKNAYQLDFSYSDLLRQAIYAVKPVGED